jgi:hypothetical protein
MAHELHRKQRRRLRHRHPASWIWIYDDQNLELLQLRQQVFGRLQI